MSIDIVKKEIVIETIANIFDNLGNKITANQTIFSMKNINKSRIIDFFLITKNNKNAQKSNLWANRKTNLKNDDEG